MSDTIIGTRSFERVRLVVARQRPLGFSMLADSRDAVEALAHSADMLLGVARSDTHTLAFVRQHAPTLKDLRQALPRYIEAHGTDAAVPPLPQSPLRSSSSSGRFPFDSPPPPSRAADEVPKDVAAELAGLISAALWVMQLCQLLLRELGDCHHDVIVAHSNWRWLYTRSPWTRLAHKVATASLWQMLRSVPHMLSEEARAQLHAEQELQIHRAAGFCRVAEHRLAHVIGAVYNVLATLRATTSELSLSIDLTVASPAATAARVCAELRQLLSSSVSQLLSVLHGERCSDCGGDAPTGTTSPMVDRAAATPMMRQSASTSAFYNQHEADDEAEIIAADDDPSAPVLQRLGPVARLAEKAVEDFRGPLEGQLHVPSAKWRLRTASSAVCLSLTVLLHWRGLLPLEAMLEQAAYSFDAYVAQPTQSIFNALFMAKPRAEQQSTGRELRALQEMVVDYHQDKADAPLGPVRTLALNQATTRGDLGDIHNDYVTALRAPVWGLLKGRLVRLLLIQVQKQKVDIDEVTDSMNNVLTHNDLTYRMFALMPFGVFTTVTVALMLQRRRARKAPLYADMRTSWWTLHRIVCRAEEPGAAAARRRSRRYESDDDVDLPPVLSSLPRHASDEESSSFGARRRNTVAPSLSRMMTLSPTRTVSAGRGAPDDVASSSGARWVGTLSPSDQGHILLQVHVLRLLCELVWPQRCDARSRFLEDLDDVEGKDSTPTQRLRALQRMVASNGFLRPPTEY